MNAARIVRRTVTSVVGGIVLLVGSAVFMAPAAHAVPPPQALATSISAPPADQADQPEGSSTSELSLRAFAVELERAGLFFSEGGTRVMSSSPGLGTPRQLILAQMAADRFGIVKNPFFDPRRAAVVRDGKAVADLSTGVILGHPIGSGMFGTTEVISADLLEELRARAGWSITAAREAEVARYTKLGWYVPVFLQSDEAYARSKEAARANYTALAKA